MYYSATHSRPHRTVKQNRAQNYNIFWEWQNKKDVDFLMEYIYSNNYTYMFRNPT